MEGSESGAIFDSLNLNPQLFVNEVLNTVDDVVDDAFDFFYQEASAKLNPEGAERSQDLRKGVDCIRSVIQAVLDKRLAIWKKYCLRHCFSVPQSFVMQKSVGKASEMLDQEVQALERRSISNSGLINETLLLRDQNSFHELFQEIATAASELGTKIGNLKSSMTEQTEKMNTKGIYNQKNDLSAADYAKGFSNVKFEDLEEFFTVMKNV